MGLEAVVVVDVVFVVLVVCQLQDLESSFFRNTGIEQVYTTYYPKHKSKKQKKKNLSLKNKLQMLLRWKEKFGGDIYYWWSCV